MYGLRPQGPRCSAGRGDTPLTPAALRALARVLGALLPWRHHGRTRTTPSPHARPGARGTPLLRPRRRIAATTGSATAARPPPGTALRRDQRERPRGLQMPAPACGGEGAPPRPTGAPAATAKASLREVGGWGACLGLGLAQPQPQPIFRPGGGPNPAAGRALSRLARVPFARHPEGLALTEGAR